MTETPALRDPRLEDLTHELVVHERVGSLEEAAEKRGLPPSAVIKTIVIRKGEGDYVFVLVPGDRVIDWAKLRSFLGERRLSLPDAEEAFAVTGYVRGTITPFGATHAWPVLADSRLIGQAVSVGGGAPGVSLTVDGDALVKTLEVRTGDLTKEP